MPHSGRKMRYKTHYIPKGSENKQSAQNPKTRGLRPCLTLPDSLGFAQLGAISEGSGAFHRLKEIMMDCRSHVDYSIFHFNILFNTEKSRTTGWSCRIVTIGAQLVFQLEEEEEEEEAAEEFEPRTDKFKFEHRQGRSTRRRCSSPLAVILQRPGPKPSSSCMPELCSTDIGGGPHWAVARDANFISIGGCKETSTAVGGRKEITECQPRLGSKAERTATVLGLVPSRSLAHHRSEHLGHSGRGPLP
ncbi:hypothetical protein K474DRAFT_1677781 [Panus rudis PR-1116 ss-1]|nr:hypothetical protein K474DRAFT_1677781 [Panus rudis PR-1116 ss-1]